MPVLIEQNRNAKEATHIITEKRKKTKKHGQERPATMPTRQSQNVAKNFVTNRS